MPPPPTVPGDQGEYIKIKQHVVCGGKKSYALTWAHTAAPGFV